METKEQISELPTLEHIMDRYQVHLFDDGYSGVFNAKSKKYLKPNVADGMHNYISYGLATKDGEVFKVYQHRAIGLAFLDGYEEGFHIDHIDNEKSNNHISNLQWLSQGDNTRKAVRDGRGIGRPKVEKEPKVYKTSLELSVNSRNASKQTTYDEVTYIFELLNDGYNITDIAKELGVSNACISYIKSGKRWKDHPASIEYREEH